MNWSFATKPGLVCGCIHVLALLATAIHIQCSSDPQTALLWIKRWGIDLPFGLLYRMAGDNVAVEHFAHRNLSAEL